MLSSDMKRNKEYRATVIGIVLTFIGFIGISIGISYLQWTSLNKALMDERISLIGKILHEHPELEGTIIPHFTEDTTESDLTEGITVAEKYGFHRDIPLKFTDELYRLFRQNVLIQVSTAILLLLSCLAIVRFAFHRLYGFIRSVSLGADQIMRGSYETSFGDRNEGDLSILGLQFNQMSQRLQLSFNQLHIEQERLRNLIPDISHQLKTPLSSLSMHNELPLGGDLSAEEMQTFLRKNQILIERMEWLTQTLLSLSRLESGAVQIHRSTHDLREAVLQSFSSLEDRASVKNQSFRYHFPDHPILVSYDRRWLQEALDNLVQNAIHYTPSKGSITISLTESELLATFTVHDTGIGISKEDLPYIFERFFRSGSAVERTGIGSGIGLSLAKLIVDKHEGQIEVSSQPREGSTFSVILPKSK